MRELRERAELILKAVCIILAVIVFYQFVGVIRQWNPFHGATVPELPSLSAGTNAVPAHSTNHVATTKGTNGIQNALGTNTATVRNGNTNSSLSSATANATNLMATNSMAATTNAGTNFISPIAVTTGQTNSITSTNSAKSGTNILLSSTSTNTSFAAVNSNSIAHVELEITNTNAVTNAVAGFKTNGPTNSAGGTNSSRNGTNVLYSSTAKTNTVPGRNERRGANPGLQPQMAGMDSGPSGAPGRGAVELPAATKARISKITDSEILGPVPHPLPQALLGIAGNVAFLRSANGQTGLVKEGDSLGDIKLLRIGINRVLIEQDGEKKELTIFNGYGSESLLQNNSTNENNHL